MGGLIILGAILIPTLLFADLTNIYIIIILITTIWLGFIGFIDDYIMVFKKDKKGLAAKFKILGQVTLGLFVGLMMYYHPDIVIRERTSDISFIESIEKVETDDLRDVANDLYSKKNIKSTKSTISRSLKLLISKALERFSNRRGSLSCRLGPSEGG